MLHLLDYILEEQDSEKVKSLKDKLIKYVKTSNDIRYEDLKRAYNVLQSTSEDEYNSLKALYKGNEEGLKNVIHILEKTGQKTEFLKLLLNKENFPTFNDLLPEGENKERHIHKLYDIVKDKKFDITSVFEDDTQCNEFLEKLLDVSYKVSGKGVGAGELFLHTLFKNTKQPKQEDVSMDDKEIEVKFSKTYSENGGRLVTAKTNVKSVDEISEYFEKLLKEKNIKSLDKFNRNNHDKIIIATSNHINNIFDILKDELTEKEIFILLGKMYFYQFTNLSKKEKEFNEFIESYDKFTYDDLIRIHGCLSLISYHEEDSWDWLLVGVKKTSAYYMINGNDCKADNFINNLKNLIKDTNFVFKKGPSNTNGAQPMQDKVSAIYVANK